MGNRLRRVRDHVSDLFGRRGRGAAEQIEDIEHAFLQLALLLLGLKLGRGRGAATHREPSGRCQPTTGSAVTGELRPPSLHTARRMVLALTARSPGKSGAPSPRRPSSDGAESPAREHPAAKLPLPLVAMHPRSAQLARGKGRTAATRPFRERGARSCVLRNLQSVSRPNPGQYTLAGQGQFDIRWIPMTTLQRRTPSVVSNLMEAAAAAAAPAGVTIAFATATRPGSLSPSRDRGAPEPEPEPAAHEEDKEAEAEPSPPMRDDDLSIDSPERAAARDNPVWVADAPCCMLCRAKSKKHHCRCCGWALCALCCPDAKRLELTSRISSTRGHQVRVDQPAELKRVCNSCLLQQPHDAARSKLIEEQAQAHRELVEAVPDDTWSLIASLCDLSEIAQLASVSRRFGVVGPD